ncbi:hypothetical protein CR513_26299, partial [Mucuna pruriens]
MIFPTDFYVLDIEDETSGKGSTLILGRPFLMTARTKIDVHVGMLLMEFDFAKDTDSIACLGSLTKVADYDEVWEVHNLFDSEDDNVDLAKLSHKAEWIKLLDQVCKYENSECVNKGEIQVA